MESLYKAIGMDILPDEYLPDDYTGPSAGPIQQIVGASSHCNNTLFTGLIMSRISYVLSAFAGQLAADDRHRMGAISRKALRRGVTH